MLFTSRINNIVTAYPKLSRVWIKTGDLRMPLRSVWIDESPLQCTTPDFRSAEHADEPAELAEDHLRFGAWLSLSNIPRECERSTRGVFAAYAFPS